MPETYLGDGLYAKFDGWDLTLWADRGGVKHYVVLEPVVFGELMRFMRSAIPNTPLALKTFNLEKDSG